METFTPKLTSGHRYDGFKLGDRELLFTKSAKAHCAKEFTIMYDRKKNLIHLKDGGALNLPKNGRIVCDFSELPVMRGRYIHQGEELYKHEAS